MKKVLTILFFIGLHVIYAGTDSINISLSPSTIDCADADSSMTTSNFNVSIGSPLPYKIYKIEIKDPNDNSSIIHVENSTKTNIKGTYKYKVTEGKHSLQVILNYTDGSDQAKEMSSVTITNDKNITCPGG